MMINLDVKYSNKCIEEMALGLSKRIFQNIREHIEAIQKGIV